MSGFRIINQPKNWKNLRFYKKSNTLYQMTYRFTQRFITGYDRTRDQMVQAARSGKQNIVEGSEDGATSTKMEIDLMNIARASIHELREDYADYLKKKGLEQWTEGHPRYDKMLSFCKGHNDVEEYEPFFNKWTDEEMANVGITLCHQVDKMMTSYIKYLEVRFEQDGGIKERMTAARLGYRSNQKLEIEQLKKENELLKAEIAHLRMKLKELEGSEICT